MSDDPKTETKHADAEPTPSKDVTTPDAPEDKKVEQAQTQGPQQSQSQHSDSSKT